MGEAREAPGGGIFTCSLCKGARLQGARGGIQPVGCSSSPGVALHPLDKWHLFLTHARAP